MCALKGSIHVAFLWSILKFITNLKMSGESLSNKKHIQISKSWKKTCLTNSLDMTKDFNYIVKWF
jgi:hypothetical protein